MQATLDLEGQQGSSKDATVPNAIWLCVCVQSTATLDCPAGLPFDFARLSIHCIIVISHPLSPALPGPALTGGCLLSPLIVDLAFLGSFFFRVFSLFM